MNWSTEVENIFSAFDKHSANILVNACPGAGKTTVLNALWDKVSCSVIYMCFNTSNANEAKLKLQPKLNGSISTIHSFGLQTLKSKYPYAKVNKWKVSNIVKSTYRFEWSAAQVRERSYDISRVVSVLKNNALFSVSFAHIREICYELDIISYEGIEEAIWRVFSLSLEETEEIDFDDMLAFPVFYQIKPEEYELVLIDEAQDLNPIQYDFLKMMSGRFIFVGDRHQSIYAFRGAMPDGMDLISNSFNCIDMPMTLTYRCAQNIVEIARQYWPNDIQALPNAPEGIVREATDIEEYTSNDLIICRNNAPLIRYAYKLLRDNTPCFVRGRDIGENLIRWIQHFPTQRNETLYTMASEEIDIEQAIARERGDYIKIERLEDKLRTLEVFIVNCRSKNTSDLIRYIKYMFEEGNGVQLSTIHKAKGLEAERVFFLDSHLAHYKRKNEDSIAAIQRLNTCYVGVTRAKEELIYINS